MTLTAQRKEKTSIQKLMTGDIQEVTHRLKKSTIREITRIREHYNSEHIGQTTFQSVLNLCLQSGLESAASILNAPEENHKNDDTQEYKNKCYRLPIVLMNELRRISVENGTTLQEVINHTIEKGFEGMEAHYS